MLLVQMLCSGVGPTAPVPCLRNNLCCRFHDEITKQGVHGTRLENAPLCLQIHPKPYPHPTPPHPIIHCFLLLVLFLEILTEDSFLWRYQTELSALQTQDKVTGLKFMFLFIVQYAVFIFYFLKSKSTELLRAQMY